MRPRMTKCSKPVKLEPVVKVKRRTCGLGLRSKIFNKSGQYLLVGFFVLIGIIALPVSAVEWQTESLPAYDQLFQRTNGWIGADGNFAVTLTNGLTLWLFSDTLMGEVRDGCRQHATMIHNSAAWQHGTNATSAHVEFFCGTAADGKPVALISPNDGRGYFWLFDSVMAQGKLFLFLAQIESTGDGVAFGFRQIGTWLGEVSNPFASPTQWHIVQKQIPFEHHGMNENYSFGSAILKTNGFIYIFGTREFKGAGKKMIPARAPETELDNFAAWQFRTHGDWTTNIAAMADLCGGMASEYSVSWLPALRQYVLICTENGLSEKIMARTAPEPWGTWGGAKMAYRCPEPANDKRTFCYSAKAHPMLGQAADELIVTYAANSFEFSQLMQNARLYWPRFVRVKLESATVPGR
jgi:hypothetical protein